MQRKSALPAKKNPPELIRGEKYAHRMQGPIGSAVSELQRSAEIPPHGHGTVDVEGARLMQPWKSKSAVRNGSR